MKSLIKHLTIIAFGLVMTVFTPVTHAQIFGPSNQDTPYGICLSEVAKTDPTHEHYQTCQNVDCEDPQDEEEEIKCTSEANVGTTLAGESLDSTGLTHSDNFGDFVIKLVNAALPYLALAAFLGYLVAGVMYVTALGNDEQLGKAKKIILWSSVGLIIVILSFAITQFFTSDLVQGLNA